MGKEKDKSASRWKEWFKILYLLVGKQIKDLINYEILFEKMHIF